MLPPSIPELRPSDDGANKEAVVEVRYWLRLLLSAPSEAGSTKPRKQWWSTHAILLQRTPVLPGV